MRRVLALAFFQVADGADIAAVHEQAAFLGAGLANGADAAGDGESR